MTDNANHHEAKDSAHEPRKDDIALKYLELARAEILERIKLRYQILIAYAGAVGAVALWAYPNQLTPLAPGSTGVDISVINARLATAGVIVAFLAVVANWINYHNERLVNGLARYQLYLGRTLPGVTSWEASKELRKTDNWIHVIVDLGTQGILVLVPAGVAWAADHLFLHLQWNKS